MFTNTLRRIHDALRSAESHPITAELKTRQEIAFSLLEPQVQIVKRSPTVQLAYGTVVSSLLLTGNLTAAAILVACWYGSRPLTHVVAGGVAGVGMADNRLLDAIDRLQVLAAEPA